MKKEALEQDVNDVFNIAVYLQLMGAFVPGVEFRKIKDILISTHDFLEKSSKEEIENKLPDLKNILQKMADPFLSKFPPKKDINTIASTWNELFKTRKDVFSNGITYGWLEELMDLKNLSLYDFIPYHFRIGLVVNKGYYGIEEEFLLKDAFNAFVKAEYYYNILVQYGDKAAKREEALGNKEFEKEAYKQITELKYEVSAYSRLTIISFFAFLECLVNSIGFSHLERYKNSLNEKEIELLKGLKKGGFISLKSKIEKYHALIRKDKKLVIITSDDKQIKEPFFSFFEQYEELRNASVHYSPLKEQIWLKPLDWLEKARKFSKLSVEAGLEFWKACFENSDGPQYLGKLDYDLHYNLAKERLSRTEKIKLDLSN